VSAAADAQPPGTRERLLWALAELCAERGYEEISIEQIVARAGATPEEFEAIFGGDKEACAVALENAILAEVAAAVGGGYSADRSEWDNVLHGVRAILELMAANPSYAFIGYIAARQMAPASVRAVYESGHRMLRAMIERGWEYSEGDAQPGQAAMGVLGGAEAIIRREVMAGRAGELPRLLPDFVYAATVPFLGQENALRLARRARELLRAPP
jgi:AcrR family transcriptional regulator